ncbi:lipocalin family protein [Marivirga sp. S37H4]|uniref:Lipocalin family protein n=1 Tax=Marivirga aurantiaca TaxID=2802615 RepID=A0A934WXD5_9BACT|nr:lipocalin family protein [Marivirga aurantiaca]MBK6264888.1 lipocalin family protein [Marivirga aurantiaca]
MKNLQSILFLALMATVLFSCNKDKDSVEEVSIIGAWTVEEMDYTATLNGIDIIDLYVISGGSEQEAFIFEATFEAFLEALVVNSVVEFNENNSFEVTQPNGTPEPGNWAINSDASMLTLIFEDDTEVALEIASLATNQLVLNGIYTLPIESLPIDIELTGSNDRIIIDFDLKLIR